MSTTWWGYNNWGRPRLPSGHGVAARHRGRQRVGSHLLHRPRIRAQSVGAPAYSQPPNPEGMTAMKRRLNETETVVGLAGDWEGNRAVGAAVARDVRGARGHQRVPPGRPGVPARAHTVDSSSPNSKGRCRRHGITIYLTPGNHEDYARINALPVRGGWARLGHRPPGGPPARPPVDDGRAFVRLVGRRAVGRLREPHRGQDLVARGDDHRGRRRPSRRRRPRRHHAHPRRPSPVHPSGRADHPHWRWRDWTQRGSRLRRARPGAGHRGVPGRPAPPARAWPLPRPRRSPRAPGRLGPPLSASSPSTATASTATSRCSTSLVRPSTAGASPTSGSDTPPVGASAAVGAEAADIHESRGREDGRGLVC